MALRTVSVHQSILRVLTPSLAAELSLLQERLTSYGLRNVGQIQRLQRWLLKRLQGWVLNRVERWVLVRVRGGC